MNKYSKYDIPHLPFASNIIDSFSIDLQPQRHVDSQLIQIEQQIHLKDQSEDEDIFEQNVIQGKRVRNRKTKTSLFVQNQTIKKQIITVNKKNDELKSKLDQTIFMLKQKEMQLKHSQSSLNDLTTALKTSQKRKSILELDLSKLYNHLEITKSQIENYQKETTRLLKMNSDKDSQIIDIMHRNSQEIKDLKQQQKQIIDQYQSKQEQTKKLLKKLNAINQQKEQKLRQQANGFKLSYQKVSNISVQQDRTIKKLQDDNKVLQQYIKNNTSRYEIDLVNMKNESDKIIKQTLTTKESQINKIMFQFQTQVQHQKVQIKKLEDKLRSEQNKWREISQEKQKNIQALTAKLNQGQRLFEKTVLLKDKDIQKLTDELQRKYHAIQGLQISNEQFITKNATLQTSIKDIYRQTSQLQSRFLQTSKQKTALTNQNNSLKAQIRQLNENLKTTETKLEIKTSQQTRLSQQIKQMKQICHKLQQDLKHITNNLKSLQQQYQQVSQSQASQKNANTQYRQMIIQKQLAYETLKDKYLKLQQFIEIYKTDSDKTREITQKKWYELRLVYQKQLEQIQQKLVTTQKKNNALKLKLEEIDRSNKIYEFQNNISPNIGVNTNLYYKK